MMTTAVTFLDRKWPHLRREDDVLLRAHVGRIDDLRWDEMSDEELVARVSAELQFLLPTFGDAERRAGAALARGSAAVLPRVTRRW